MIDIGTRIEWEKPTEHYDHAAGRWEKDAPVTVVGTVTGRGECLGALYFHVNPDIGKGYERAWVSLSPRPTATAPVGMLF